MKVGYLWEVIGDIDIGLFKLDDGIEFENILFIIIFFSF